MLRVSADWVDAFIVDVENLDVGEAAPPLPRTESGTPTMPQPTEAAAFRDRSADPRSPPSPTLHVLIPHCA